MPRQWSCAAREPPGDASGRAGAFWQRLTPMDEEAIVPQAILFDLDETLIDRTRSIMSYAERFQHDFTDHLAPTTVSTIATAILTADERGYRPREELFGELVQS